MMQATRMYSLLLIEFKNDDQHVEINHEHVQSSEYPCAHHSTSSER